jgi:RecD/TraA family predicted helicase
VQHGTGNFLFDESDIEQKLALMEKQLKVTYEAKQRRLFFEGNRNKIVVLTGFAGTGKSFLINGYLKIMESKFNSIMLVSPTAKAAKVLSKATGRTATTIHRALKWMFGKFVHNLHNKLRCDLIVVDEASMIDIYLFRSLLQALPDNCRMVIIGDTAQLESVAVGNVLHDIINSQCFPVISLTEVYRQALDSGSLLAATLVRQGRKFYDENMLNCEMGLERDFKAWFGTKEQSCDRVKSLYASAVKIWDTEDILVITPMKIGNAGVVNLNKELQNIANPLQRQKQLVVNKNTFRENDKVRHTKNDYQAPWLDKDYNQVESQEKGVFNGDFGKIKEIVGNLIYVDYGDKIIRYIPPYQSLDLAYAITVHSSQGSQSPVVIGVLDVSHYLNLKRNLLYTMMTRAENNLYLIAQKKALGMAISNNTIPQKQTFLEEHLKK